MAEFSIMVRWSHDWLRALPATFLNALARFNQFREKERERWIFVPWLFCPIFWKTTKKTIDCVMIVKSWLVTDRDSSLTCSRYGRSRLPTYEKSVRASLFASFYSSFYHLFSPGQLVAFSAVFVIGENGFKKNTFNAGSFKSIQRLIDGGRL